MVLHQRPSDDLPTLGAQLSTSLDTLAADATGPDARDFRRFLRRALAHAWRAAATGEFKVVREVIDLLRDARPRIDDALPGLSPRELAAVEVLQALAALYVGEDELREVELENRLADRGRHPTERAVLEVLAAAERPLRQAEVHERLDLPKKAMPTPSRVGQILRELYDHGFALRQLARARGYSEVSHYQLAPRGLALCGQLGISTIESKMAKEAAPAMELPSRRLPARGAALLEGLEVSQEKWPIVEAALERARIDSWMLLDIFSGLAQSAKDEIAGCSYLVQLKYSDISERSIENARDFPKLKQKLEGRGRAFGNTREVFDQYVRRVEVPQAALLGVANVSQSQQS